MSYTLLYLIFVVLSIALFNALIVMARYAKQLKKPPEEEDYLRLESELKTASLTIDTQNQEIVELKLRVQEFEEMGQRQASEEPQSSNEPVEAAS